MKTFRTLSLGLLLFGILCLLPRHAVAMTFEELTFIYDSQLVPFGPSPINLGGTNVSYTVIAAGAPAVIIYDENLLQVIYSGSPDRLAELQALAAYFGIPLTSLLTPSSIADPDSAASMVSRLVFDALVLPAVAPRTEQQRGQKLRQEGKLRAFGGAVRTEWIDDDQRDEKGDIYSFNLGLAQDFDNITMGILVPYDHLDFDGYDADRLSAILFGQYHFDLNEAWQATVTANGNYAYTDINFSEASDEIVNTGGGGLSASLSYSAENFEAGGALSWQYNRDDTNADDDEQHMFRSGAHLGLHLTQEQSLTFSGTWSKDLSDYVFDYGDNDYFDLGAEYRADFFESWAISFGYKKIVDLDDYRSDMIYLGSAMQF